MLTWQPNLSFRVQASAAEEDSSFVDLIAKEELKELYCRIASRYLTSNVSF